MNSTWQTKKFEDCLENVTYTAKVKRGDFLESGKYPIISQESKLINGYWNKSSDLFFVKDPIIIFGDHTKVIKYIDFDFVLGADGVKILRPKSFLHPRFFYYFLNHVELKNLGYARHYRLLKDVSVLLPPFPDQQRIVKILDKTFESITKAKSIAEKNLQNSKNLLEVYLDLVFSNPAKEWAEKSLKEVCKYDKSPNKTTNLPYIGLEDIQSNTGKLVGPIDPRSVKSLTFHFTKEHVLYGRLRPYLNKVLLPDFEGHCSTEIFPIKPEENVLNRDFLFHWLISIKTMNKINATWTGATLPRANMNTVLDFKINIPPISEQKIISEKIDKLSIEIKNLESIYQQKLADLEELKKSILGKAFNGDL